MILKVFKINTDQKIYALIIMKIQLMSNINMKNNKSNH